MAKPEWGLKRTCVSCGSRFYDLRKMPIVCPVCGTENPAEPMAKGRRRPVRAAIAPEPVVKKPRPADVIAPDLEVESDDLVEAEEEEEDVLEDTADLGEDDDDMSEVMEHVETDEDD